MPIHFEYDEEQNVVYETGEGPLPLENFLAYRAKLAQLPLRPGFRVLADYMRAHVNVTYEEMSVARDASAKVAVGLGPVKLAICSADDLGYGMARMFSMAAANDTIEVEVFRSLAKGRAWLGLD